MASNVSRTEYTIFHIQGKSINTNLKIWHDNNEPKIFELERIHDNHVIPENGSYKLLGIKKAKNILTKGAL
jgi:hypothetical protein